MELKRTYKYPGFITMACLALALLTANLLTASEHRGVVKFGGLPVPGATITASQGEKKYVAVTDQQGAYTFADLPDGVWNLQVEMLCFATLKQEVAIAPNAPSPEWELKMLPFDEIKASAPAPAPAPAGAPSTSAASTPAASPAAANNNPSLVASVKAADAAAAKGKKGAKTAAVGPTSAKSGFQRTDVNASAGAGAPD